MSDLSTVTVLFFAGARDAAQTGEATVEIPREGIGVDALTHAIVARYAALAPYERAMRLAVNGEYARQDTVVRPGDEVAVIPPVAGGS